MENLEQIIITALVTAFFVAPASAFFTIKIQQLFERKGNRRKKLFDIYMKLIELEGQYFWLASAEMRNTKKPKDILQKANYMKYEISDMAREIDAYELKEILETLFLEELSYRDRQKKTVQLVEEFGYKVNPRFKKIISKIIKRNETYAIKQLKEENLLHD